MKKILILLTLCSCMATLSLQAQPLDSVYFNSVNDASNPTHAEIYSQLTPIDPANKDLIWKEINGQKYLLVVSWKSNASWYENDKNGVYNTKSWPIWVTVVPQLQDFCNVLNQQDTSARDLRLKQLLGVPKTGVYKYMIEFWVRPQDLFRPCPDNEITDRTCGLCIPDHAPDWYRQWFNELRAVQYYNKDSLYQGYPWTQLGYTYDWNPSNTTHVGLSEFVIKPHVDVVIRRKYTTSEYCESHY